MSIILRQLIESYKLDHSFVHIKQSIHYINSSCVFQCENNVFTVSWTLTRIFLGDADWNCFCNLNYYKTSSFFIFIIKFIFDIKSIYPIKSSILHAIYCILQFILSFKLVFLLWKLKERMRKCNSYILFFLFRPCVNVLFLSSDLSLSWNL